MRTHLMIGLVLFAVGLPALSGDYYSQYVSALDTNRFTQPLSASPALVDTNNNAIKLTNAVLDLKSLKQNGEVSGVRLGMTMQEVVNRWGKPRGGWSRCLHGLTTFSYSGVSLAFNGNCLETVRFYPPASLADGLSSVSTVNDFVRVLGQPTSRRDSGQHPSLVYLSPSANLVLDFTGGELSTIYLERTPSRAEPWRQTTGANQHLHPTPR